ncbi:hypothetical protein BBAD15_g12524 [Beauveria bassiana D1-5]|uniref:Uncharacterized protein n=1 Tax=Beauveria bassiana D1-5 TaxID=1245745 RepID=A0A0A2V7H9_BEABA|nr:hypothetical protein BBAD15_g12524 [Beauveria bassiana D1-5]
MPRSFSQLHVGTLHGQQPLRTPHHHQYHHQTEHQHPVLGELARQLGQHRQQDGGEDHAHLRPHAAQHHDRQDQRRLDEGEGFGVDHALARREERAAETGEGRAQRERRQLDAGRVQAQRTAGDLVLAQRLPGAADRHADQARRDEQRHQRQQQRHHVQIDHHVLVLERQAEEVMERGAPFRAGATRHLQAEHRRLGNARDTVRTARERVQVDQQQADHFAEAQRHDGQVVAAQAQHREAQDEAEQRGHRARERQRLPEAPAAPVVQQGVGIGADGVEADEAQVQQPGETDHDVQAQAQHHVDQHQRGDVDRAAAGEERPGHGHRQDQEHQQLVALGRGRGQGRQIGLELLERLGDPGPQQLEHEHDRGGQGHQRPVRLHRRAGALTDQLQAEDGGDDDGGQHRRHRGVFEIVVRHQTFSTSGCRERFGQAQQHAAQHGAGDAADAAQHRRREGLDAGQEADEGIELADGDGDQHAAHRRQDRAHHEREGDHAVGVDAQQVGHVHVLRAGARGAAHAGVLDEQRQADHQRHGHQDDHDARIRHRHIEVGSHVELHRAGHQRWHRHVARALAQGDPVLQEDRHADGRDQRHQAGAAPHRAVRDPLDAETVDAGDDDGHQQHGGDDERDRQAATGADGREGDQADIGADHVDFAVSEVDHTDDAVDHCVADGNQRVDRAQRQSVEELLVPAPVERPGAGNLGVF